MEPIQAILEIKIEYKHLNSSLSSIIEEKLRNKYMLKIWKNIVIQDFDTQNQVTYLNVLTQTLGVKVLITKYISYKVNDVLEGTIDLAHNPPLFKSDHIKLSIMNVNRQSDIISLNDGTKYNNGSTCKVLITRLDIVEGIIFFHGTCNIISTE